MAARFKSAQDDQFQYGDEDDEDDASSINRPRKEPLKFNVDPSQLPPKLAQLILEIQRTAESSLFHWKTFPLNPPQPLAVQELSEGTASTRRKPLVIDNLFDLPAWDELDAVSVDRTGEAKRLSGKQLASIRKHGLTEKAGSWRSLTADQMQSIRQSGTFTVPSINFPGQHHVWKLSPFLQMGSEPAMDSLLKALAWSAALVGLAASERINGDVFSLRSSAQSLRTGLRSFLDLVLGMPSLHPRDFEARLHEERSRYLVAELLCAVHCQEEYIALCRFIRHLVGHQQSGGGSGRMDVRTQQKSPPLPYTFQTPKGQLIDLRLFSREMMDQIRPVVNAVLQAQSKTRWSHHHHRQGRPPNKAAEIRKSSEAEGSASPRADEGKEEELWESLASHPDLERLGPGVGQLLVDQARATLAMKRAAGRVREKFTADLIQAEVDIRLRHPLLSLVQPWMDKELRQVKARLAEEYRWKCHEEAIESCRIKSLDQFVYFLTRDLAFLRDRAPVLSKELLADKQATRTFAWDTWIWCPRSWIVRRHFRGRSEVIPTHLSTTPTSITSPRTGSGPDHHSGGGGQEQPVYTLERSSRRTTSTQWPLWRWTNFLQRAWSWSWNGAYACGYIVPWCSPIGLRALLSAQPFYADLELSQVNGALCPRRSAYTPTLSSRLSSLWRHISKSRTEFETQPDTGLVGKGLTRQVNRAWNYGIKGFLCSALLLLFFPAVCLLCSLGGLFLAAAAPLWAPLLALVYHLLIVLVYDVDNPDPGRRGPLLPLIRVLGRDILLEGLIQPVACLATAFVLCPLLSLLLALYGLLFWMLSRARDSLVFNLIIRPRSRVPASDGCLVKRIAGPGLNADFYYQISKEQALAAFEARLEADRLVAYRRQTERLIRRPAEEFRTFVQQIFSPFFSGTPWLLGTTGSATTPVASAGDKAGDKSIDPTTPSSRTGNVAVQLERETQGLLASLEEKVERRLYELRMPLKASVLKRIRLSSEDLKAVLIRSAMLVRSFYPAEILARLGVNEAELWERYNVEEGDWLALAAIFLGEIFSPTILSPLTETDTRVQLETKEANLSRYTAMFSQAELESGGMEPFEWPLKALLPSQAVQQLPDFACFSPLARDAAHNSSPPWKKKRTNQQSAGRSSGGPGWADQKKKTTTGSMSARDATGPSSSSAISGAYPAGWSCELLVPLPIPHPILICLLIYNRHRDVGAIPLESDACRILIRYLEGGSSSAQTPSGRGINRPPMMLEAVGSSAGAAGVASRSPASHKPLLGSSGSDLALSHPSLANDFSSSGDNSPSGGEDGSSQVSPSHGAGHDTLVSIAQDGTLSLVGTLMSEHASVVDMELAMDQEPVVKSLSNARLDGASSVEVTVNLPASSSKDRVGSGLSTTLARAADTLRAAFLGEKADDQLVSVSSGRKYSAENFELLPSSEDPMDSDRHHHQASGGEAAHSDSSDVMGSRGAKKFPTYQPATFKSWRMNLPPPLRYDPSPSDQAATRLALGGEPRPPASPRPLGLFELSSGLAQDRGPAFSPAQLAVGRRLMASQGGGGGNMTASSSQDSLPFAEEDASLVDSPDPWPDASIRQRQTRHQASSARALGQPYCEMQPPPPALPPLPRPSAAVLASIEDLSVSLDSSLQHGTQV